MPNFDILKKTEAKQTFRVASIIGKFDLQSDIIEETFTGKIDLESDWQIGVIVGASGTGKTTIAKELFADAYVTTFDYSASSIVDDMPSHCSIDEITKMFNSVGFSSPPSWLKPYSVLSNGQKMRVDLAKAMLNKNDLIVFDEFTSVVDRNVAKIGSYAVQKAIRKTDKKFIAVTCHNDVVDWILPDWIFNTDTMTFQKLEGQKKNRPKIKFEIFQAADKNVWQVFAKHHYLSHSHNKAAHVYIAYINEQLAGFISINHLPHPKVKNLKMVHRLVVLPDYQGVGIGVRLLEFIANKYVKDNYRFKIITSAPSLIHYFKKSTYWKCNHFGRMDKQGSGVGPFGSGNRITTSWEYDKK